jgi:pimeloyl-ACP methyl ester carboxylesterase
MRRRRPDSRVASPEPFALTPAGPFTPEPAIRLPSVDGTSIAIFGVEADVTPGPEASRAAALRPPLLLVHGASADHTTFRVLGPLLARERAVYAMDRRGRGASGDAAAGSPYSIELEYDDVAVAAAASGARHRSPVDVLGHSYGGRCALGAALRSSEIRRVVAYEGAPAPAGATYQHGDVANRVRAAIDRGDPDAALVTFLAEVVGMSEPALAAYRADPIWPTRVAAAHTILRELGGEAAEGASIGRLRAVSVPVLLVLGVASPAPFRVATDALAGALPRASVRVIAGAAHAAHHTHAPELVAAVERFLDAPDSALDGVATIRP